LLLPLPLMPLPLLLLPLPQVPLMLTLSEDSLPQPLDYPMLRQEDLMPLPLEPQKGLS
jgi:hypothetical protein